MQIEFLNIQTTEKTISRLMAEYDEFFWAIAWGSFSKHGQALIEYKEKFRSVTFGVAFSQTDPDLIDALAGVEHAYVVPKIPNGTYHPKVYCFRSNDRMAAIIGSANYTRGGLHNNIEAAVLITGNIRDKIFDELLSFIQELSSHHKPISKDFAAAYRASYVRASRLGRPPHDPVAANYKANLKRMTSRIVNMTWQEYLKNVRFTAHHDISNSLELLRISQQWFASVTSFKQLTTPQRKAIAGTLGEYQKTDAQLTRDWGWFGSMQGMGDFANRIEQNDQFMARAIDTIPRHGEVTKIQYDEFVKNFRQAFENSDRKGGVATASRLLAMKRPDTFLCICGPNIAAASEAMGFAKTTLNLDNYWNHIVEVIRLSEWYHIERPMNDDTELWDCRAAMLDAIYYQPK